MGNTLGGLTGIGKSMTIFSPTATSPRVQQFSFDIQRELGSGWVASIGYSGSRSAPPDLDDGAENYQPAGSEVLSAWAPL
ncbi:MAG: hypothetical protein QM757_13480 [Paludibaculum sp.]